MTTSLTACPAITDSRTHAREYKEGLKELFAELSSRKFFLEGFDGVLDVERWNRRKKAFTCPSLNINAYAGTAQPKAEVSHPVLHQQLRKLRDAICFRKDLPIYFVAGTRTLDEMSQYLPQTLAELRRIRGFGDARIAQYGQQFLDIIVAYCQQRGLSSSIHEKAPKRERKETVAGGSKSQTKTETYRLYQEGKGVAEIAKERNLTIQTIEGHLSHYVATGQIQIEDLVPAKKIAMIEPFIKGFNGGTITPIKNKLGPNVGYGEIKLVIAWQHYRNTIAQPK
jgi:hypothetical protein